MKHYYVYILTSQTLGTLYIGITSDLKKRVWEHKEKATTGFTEKYDINKLVYYEVYDDPENAIQREKRLKKWNREWKTNLVHEFNPEWQDLYEKL
jgi:putative endonuclease